MALVCLNLASKYTERVAFKITDLLKLNQVEFSEDLTEEDWRKKEFEVLTYLNFRVGGQENSLEFLENSFSKIPMLVSLPQLVKDHLLKSSSYLLFAFLTVSNTNENNSI